MNLGVVQYTLNREVLGIRSCKYLLTLYSDWFRNFTRDIKFRFSAKITPGRIVYFTRTMNNYMYTYLNITIHIF